MNQFDATRAALQRALIEFKSGPFRSPSQLYAHLATIYTLRASHPAAASLPRREIPSSADPGPQLPEAFIASWTRARRPRRRYGETAHTAARHFYRGEFKNLPFAALLIDTAAALEDSRLNSLIGRRGLALLNGFYAVAAIGILHRAGQLTPDRLQWLKRTADQAHRTITAPRQQPPGKRRIKTPRLLWQAFRQLEQDMTARDWPQSLSTAHCIIELHLDPALPDAPPGGFHQAGNDFARQLAAAVAAELIAHPDRPLCLALETPKLQAELSTRLLAQHLTRALQPGRNKFSPLGRLAHAAHTYRHTRDRDALPAAIHALVGVMETRWRDMQDC